MLKVLQLGGTDGMGARFNGQILHHELRNRGISSKHLVWNKTGSDPDTIPLTNSRWYQRLNGKINQLEYKLSIQSLLQPSLLLFLLNRHFWSADLVHYHLIHTGFFSLSNLPFLTKLRAAVWTLHDPWALTGHCIHPFDCEKWKTGCGNCPNLNLEFKMLKDNTAFMWKTKQFLYRHSNIDIIVASKWMLEKVQQSPLFSNFRVHQVPFGIDTNRFKPGLALHKRKELRIPEENVVIAIRSTRTDYKGLKHVFEAIDKLQIKKPITLLTFNEKENFNRYLGKHHVIEMGWVENDAAMIEAYQMADIFLMPSVAESFGMMAIEAMSCGKSVVVLEGTALPDTVFAPNGGIAVPAKDIDQLANVLSNLVDSPNQRQVLGERARALALQHYNLETHVERMIAIYQDVLQRRKMKLELTENRN